MFTTHAYQLIQTGASNEAFRYTELSLPDLSDDEVRIEVSHFGLNYADVMARMGLYKECPPLPTVLGYEVVGEIIQVGSDKHHHLVGKNVVAFTRFGGYAKHVNTSVYALCPIVNCTPEKALCLATQYVTAYYMTHFLTVIQPGEVALVHAGAGGVGIALLQLLKQLGVKCIAKVGNQEKVEFLKKQGVEHVINYNATPYEEKVAAWCKDQPLTVSFNPVAGATFKKDLKLLGPNGRLILFGGSERSGKKWGIFSTLNFLRKMGILIPIGLMMGSKSIMGVNMLHIADRYPELLHRCLTAVVELAEKNEIHPVVGAVYEATQLPQAHDFLASGKSIGKIVLKW